MIRIFEESYNFYCSVYFIGRTNSMGNSKLKFVPTCGCG